MRDLFSRRHLPAVAVLFLLIALLPLTGCTAGQTGPAFYNAGANDLTLTGSELAQYDLIRFDTAAGEHTLTLPTAADIVSAFAVPAGTFAALVVTADGVHNVKIVGGAGVTVRPSASGVTAGTTKTIFLVLVNVSSGTQAVTVY